MADENLNLDFSGSSEIDFAGLGDSEQITLLGRIARMPKPQRNAAFNKVAAATAGKVVGSGGSHGGGGRGTSRNEMVARLELLPEKIRQALKSKTMQLSDGYYYVVKAAGGLSTIEMFSSSDVKAAGTGNVGNAKLETDRYFLLSGIAVLSGIDAVLANTDFDQIPLSIRNGEMEFYTDKSHFVLPKTSMEVFNTDKRNNVQKGVYLLDNPKLIVPQIELRMRLSFSQALAANTNIKVMLLGTHVIPF
jgi:hypothetical protein